jgi:hypothetical protein
MATKPLIRIRFPAKNTFGEAFGAATGVSAPSYRRNHGPQATSLKTMAAKPLIRSRSPAKKTFGEAFGEAFGAATGVGAPSYRDGRLCRRDGFFWAGVRVTGVEGHGRWAFRAFGNFAVLWCHLR